MKKTKLLLLATIIATTFIACKTAPDGDEAKTSEAKTVTDQQGAATYSVNTTTSKLEWIGTKVTAHHNGTVNIKSGNLVSDGTNLTGGSFILDMPTLISTYDDAGSNEKLTGHLKSPDFFDVALYPEAKFEITSVKPFSGSVVDESVKGQDEISEYKVADPNMMISGNLTIKNETKNIEFPAKVTMTENGINALAKFNINRKNWNLNYPGAPDNLVKDEIWFGISLNATK